MSAILGAVGVRRPTGMRRAPPGAGLRRVGGALRRAAGGLGGLGTGRGGRRRRGRGISAAGIRAARKLMNLLRDFHQALPRTRHVSMARRRSYFSRRRRGDPMFYDEGD